MANSIIVSLGCILSSKAMHGNLLTNVLRWAMELFDTTPMGRILNRFAKDVDTIDNILPHVIKNWCHTFFPVNFHPVRFDQSSFYLFWFHFN